MIRQKDQVKSSKNFTEDYAPSGGFEGASVSTLEDDLNAIRTQIRKILGGGSGISPLEDPDIHWYSEPTSNLFSFSLNKKNIWFAIKTSDGETSPSVAFDTLTFDDGFGISISVSNKTVQIVNIQNQFTSFDAGSGSIFLQESPVSQPIEFVGNREIKTSIVDNSGVPEIYINYEGDLFFERRLWYNIQTYPATLNITPSEVQDTLNFIGENSMIADTQSGDVLYLEHQYDFSENGTIGVGGIFLESLDQGEVLYIGENNYVRGDLDYFSWDNSAERISIRNGFSVNNGNIKIGQSRSDSFNPLKKVISSWDSLVNPSSVVVCKNIALVGQDNEGGALLNILNVEDSKNIKQISSYTSPRSNTGGVINIASDGSYVFILFNNPFTMEVVDISNIESPSFVRSIEISSSSVSLASIEISGKCLYVSSDLGVFYCYNVSSPENPSLENSIDIEKSINSISIFSNRAYLAASSGSFDFMEVLNLDDFSIVGTYSDENQESLEFMSGIYSTGTFVYVVYRDSDRIQVINVLDTDNPEPLDRIVSFGNFTRSDILSKPISVKVYGTYAYVICAGRNGDFPRIVVIDMVNPIFPSAASVIGDGTQNRFEGISDFDISGKYAYVVGKDSGALSIVDLSSVHSPTGIIPEIFSNHVTCEKIDIAGSLNVEGGIGIGSGGLWLSGENSDIFTNSKLNVGDGLGVGFGSRPQTSVDVDYEFEVRNGKFKQNVRSATSASSTGREYIMEDILSDVVVVGDVAYVINFKFSSIDIYNIKNPKNIEFFDSVILESDFSQKISDQGGAQTNPKGYAYAYSYGFDFSLSLDYWTALESENNFGITKAKVYGKYLFITAAKIGYFIVVDISDLYNPVFVNAVFVDQPEPEVGYGANGLFIEGNKLYITSGTVVESPATGSISVFDISNPEAPYRIGYYISSNSNILDGSSDIIVSGRYAYVACASAGSVSIFDVGNPQNIIYISSFYFDDNTGNLPNSIALKGKYLYVACEEGFSGNEPETSIKGSLYVLDVSDVTSISNVYAIYNQDGELAGATKLKIIGDNIAVLCRFSATVSIFDISTPNTPSLVATLNDISYSDFGSTSFEIFDNHFIVCNHDFPAENNYVYTLPYTGAEISIAQLGSVLTSDLLVKNNIIMQNKVIFDGGVSCNNLFVRDAIHADGGYSGQFYALLKTNADYSETSVGSNDEFTWGRLQPESLFYTEISDNNILDFDLARVKIFDGGFYRLTWNLMIKSDTEQNLELFTSGGGRFIFAPEPMKFHVKADEGQIIKYEILSYISKYSRVGDEISMKLIIPTSGTQITWGRDSTLVVERL